MATITTLEGFGSRRASLHGRNIRFFGSGPVDDKGLIDAIMAKYAAIAATNGNVLTWEMNVARGKEIQAAQDAYQAWLNEQENVAKGAEAARIQANQEAAGRAMQEAQNRAMEAARARAEEERIRVEAEMRARALAAKVKAHADEQAKIVATPVYTQVGYPNTPLPPQETGPGLLQPISTTPPLLTTSTPVDVAVEPGGTVNKSSYLFPLLALGAAYWALKG